MSRHITDAYRTVRRASLVENKSPHELTLMLYDGALSHLSVARQQIHSAQFAGLSGSIDRALAITMELQGTLKEPQSNEISANLYALYGFVIDRLLAANRLRDPDALAQASEVLTTLREAWAEIAPQQAAA